MSKKAQVKNFLDKWEKSIVFNKSLHLSFKEELKKHFDFLIKIEETNQSIEGIWDENYSKKEGALKWVNGFYAKISFIEKKEKIVLETKSFRQIFN